MRPLVDSDEELVSRAIRLAKGLLDILDKLRLRGRLGMLKPLLLRMLNEQVTVDK